MGKVKYLTLIFLLSMICLRAFSSIYIDGKRNTQKTDLVAIDDIADAPCTLKWEEFEKFYYANGSYFSKLYKNLLIEKYKGKRIQWAGTVTSTSTIEGRMIVCIKMNKQSEFCDLHIELEKDEIDTFNSLVVGQNFVFSGFLMITEMSLPPQIIEGKIVKRKSIKR